MGRRSVAVGACGLVAVVVASAEAHFHVLLPRDYGQWEARRGRAVEFGLIWGHGFEHLWFDATKPTALVAYAPSGETTDLLGALKPMTVTAAGGEERKAFSLAYTPAERGDHILALTAARIWDEPAGAWLQDYVKTVLHVQDIGGWDRRVGHKLELAALNRPYALQPGQVARFVVLRDGKPLPGCEVELEKLQPKAPRADALPDEPFITFEAKSDANGIVVFGLHEAGWFAVTAVHETDEIIEQDGHRGPVVERATFWVHVAPLVKIAD
jgi:cobalt/nickel transport protein